MKLLENKNGTGFDFVLLCCCFESIILYDHFSEFYNPRKDAVLTPISLFLVKFMVRVNALNPLREFV